MYSSEKTGAVDDIILNADTAHPNISIAADKKSFTHGAQTQKVPQIPERFDSTVCVLGSEEFSNGQHYWEVDVGSSIGWDLGVARKSIQRKGKLVLSPKEGFWALSRNGRDYWAKTDPWTRLELQEKPKKIGVYLNYQERLVTFFSVTDMRCHASKNEEEEQKVRAKLLNEKEEELKIRAQQLNEKEEELKIRAQQLNEKEEELKIRAQQLNEKEEALNKKEVELNKKDVELNWRRVHRYADNITLDAGTAHPNISIAEHKSFTHKTEPQQVPSNPKRFDATVCVLGSEGFTSGKHYWEVDVESSTDWDLGVARKSIPRKGKLPLAPKEGFWVLGFSGRDCWAKTDPWTCVKVREKPKKLGVYLNYDDSQVVFFNVTDISVLFTFNECSFSEEVYPFFKNSHKETTMKICSLRKEE
ncbi:uncharacterized protein LOC142024594 [Carettochelys insculpta]|uniref:uncharacterized protein LOC142024594 n=1 Tax=Carettochelys insculpta TaxID=44489 RepID=UPI003EBAAC11